MNKMILDLWHDMKDIFDIKGSLPINEKWFCMIATGVKLEEYRALTPYYDRLFSKYEGKRIVYCLRNGYQADSPRLVVTVIPHRGLTGNEDWGAEPGHKYWVLQIVKVIQIIV